MALTKAQLIDLNGNELILDLDADTSITADTDDQIDIKIAGADDFRFTANTFTALSGSTIAAQALTATSITSTGNVVIPNAGTIGSASDADSIAISSAGVVTFSQSPVFPDGSLAVVDLDIDGATDIGAAIVDADLFIIDDGAGGTNRKVTAARVKTYMGAEGGAFSVDNLDIDGSTDIGAAIVDADLFIIDDGAGGTNRKTAASRLKTYVAASQAIVYAQSTNSTTCANNTATKIELANEIIDTASLMASSRFTVTSAYQGKYFVLFQMSFNHTALAKRVSAAIRKNGSEIQYTDVHSAKGSNHTVMSRSSIVVDMSTNDYLEFYGKQDSGGDKTSNGGTATNVQIFKIN